MVLRARCVSLLLGLGLVLGCSVSTDDGGGAAGQNGVSVLPGGGRATAGAGTSGATGTMAAGAGGASGGGSNGNAGQGNANQGGSATGGSSVAGSGGAASAGMGSSGGGTTGGSNAGAAGASSAGKGAGGNSNGGTSSGGTSAAGSSAGGSDPYGDARTRCVNRTNELRATKGLGPIPILPKAEPCADGQAKADSISGVAHSAFNACLDQVKWKGAGQNECPSYGSVQDTLTKCLDAMWAEGPGGGHYENMVGGSTHTACGFYTTPGGKVWMVQDFWTE